MSSNFPKFSLFVSVILIALSIFAFVLLYKQIDSNNTSAESTLTIWQKEQSRRDEIVALQNSMASIEADKTSLETHFAASSDIVPFLNMIENLALSVGAKAEILVVNITDDKKNLVVQLKVNGSFQSVYKFLRLLENSPYELSFNSVDLQNSSGADSSKIDAIPEWTGLFEIKLLTFTP